MCFVWIWEQTAIISLYSINWLVFITETECVYCAVRTGSLYTASLTFSNSTFCPHTVFMCFVWIWEQTAIISLYSINWLVFITETECVYCAVRTGLQNMFRVYFSPHGFKLPSERNEGTVCLYDSCYLIYSTYCACFIPSSVIFRTKFSIRAKSGSVMKHAVCVS